MNWYKIVLSSIRKIASVTFELQDANKIAQPKNLLQLGFELRDFAEKMDNGIFTGSIGYDAVGPDGASNYDGDNGVINFYFNDSYIKPERVQQVLRAWIEDKELMGFRIEEPRLEVSNRFHGPPSDPSFQYDPLNRTLGNTPVHDMLDFSDDTPTNNDPDSRFRHVRTEYLEQYKSFMQAHKNLAVYRINVTANGGTD